MNLLKWITSKAYRAKIAKYKEIKAAKKEADYLHQQTGYKYYVMYIGNKYRPMNMAAINLLRKNGILPKNFDWLQAEKNSLYITKTG